MPPRKSEKLTVKQEKFCHAYIETGNASEAYRQAYDCKKMSQNAICVQASRMLDNPKIALRIDDLRAGIQNRHQVTVDRIIDELALLGFSNMLDYMQPQDDGTAYVDLSKLTREQAAAISEVTVDSYMEGTGEDAKPVKRVKFKLTDKRGALVDLGKHLGMFPSQVNGKIEHDHKHHHSVEPLSESAQWLAKLLGGKADSETEGALLH